MSLGESTVCDRVCGFSRVCVCVGGWGRLKVLVPLRKGEGGVGLGPLLMTALYYYWSLLEEFFGTTSDYHRQHYPTPNQGGDQGGGGEASYKSINQLLR